MGDANETATFHFSGSTWRLRLTTYVQSLGRVGVLVPILAVALLPATVDRVVAFLVPGDDMFAPFLVLGLCAGGLLVGFGALVALVRRAPPSTVTFDQGGIREEVGRRITQHTWQWIVEVVEDERHITLRCKQPMRSFRLGSSTQARLLVIDKGSPDANRLTALLAAHTRTTIVV